MRKDKIQVQPFDCMNYFYNRVQEQFIRVYTRFNGHLDESALKRAVELSINAVPLISCCFQEKKNRWQKRNFTSENILQIVEVQSGKENPSEKLLLSSIDISREPQMKLFLIRETKCDTLCVILNHMVSDGAGFKDYLYLLSDLYSKCKLDSDYSDNPPPETDRSLHQLLQNLNRKEKLSILLSKTSTPKLDNTLVLPLKDSNSQPFLARHRIEAEQFIKLKSYAKENHASLNDLLLTAYMRALQHITKCERITVPCPVDLRKYALSGQKCGICNLTGNYICSVTIHSDDRFEDTRKQVSEQMLAQKDSNACLKGPMLLHLLYPFLPFQAVRKLFTVPVTSYTNLGIIDQKQFHFEGLTICDAYFATARKRAPYFQVSISTYNDCCTLTSCSCSSQEGRIVIENVLEQMQRELLRLI